jgi:hypothetical protein
VVDCDDHDAALGGPEVPYDGIDNDCDAGTPDDDIDGDGFLLAVDCDDLDPQRGGPEVVLDGIDNDCDGVHGYFGDQDGDGLALTDDCDDTDASVGSSSALGIAGFWDGDVTAADVPGFCEGYCRRPIGGSVRIEASALEDLDDLACVPRVVGDLVIGGLEVGSYGTTTDLGNKRLSSLSGLSSLVEVGGDLVITDNDALSSLSGLEQLSQIGGWLHIESQPGLDSLSGLSGLVDAGVVYVSGNPGLTSLSGLDSLVGAGSLAVKDNDGLASLEGLRALTSIRNELLIGSNEALTDVSALYGLVSVGGDVTVTGNAALTDEAAWALVDEIDLVSGKVSVYGNEAGGY